MRTVMRMLLLFGVLAGAVYAGENSPPGERPRGRPDDPFRDMEIRAHQLELQARENKLRFETEMNNFQLERQRLELERQRQRLQPGRVRWGGGHCPFYAFKLAMPLVLLGAILHILLAVWVYQDIRRRNAGSGIWIVVTLVAGLCGAAVYALVRIGEKTEK